MKQYHNLLQNIINNGVEKESGRANMPNTIGISHATIEMDLNDGFPLLTTKKMYWKGIVHELLWFLRGETNIKYLVDNKVNIWNSDAYRWYLKHHTESGYNTPPLTMEMFVDEIKNNKITDSHFNNSDYKLGDLGKVYGHQWRNQNGVDQIKEVLHGLKTNPYSRYHIIDGWNKADFPEMSLPPCHLLYQFIVRPMSFEERKDLYPKDMPGIYSHLDLDAINAPKFYLDLNMYQRSVDTFLGCPFNLASMVLLLKIFAKASNMVAGKAYWIGGDTHLYVNHIPMAQEQLKRDPRPLPTMMIFKELNGLEDILNLSITDFALVNYDPHPAIKAELFTGIKK